LTVNTTAASTPTTAANDESAPREAPKRTPSEPCLFVILGATGDLMGRKLFPALYRLRKRGLLPDHSVVLGVDVRTDVNDDSFRDRCRTELIASGVPEAELPPRFTGGNLLYQALPKGDAGDYQALAERIAAIEKEKQLSGNRVLYLALPPAAFPPVISALGQAGLNKSPKWTRIVIEKPFGHDFDSAEALNDCVHKYFAEDQVYRIDHYLGKETVQNILVFRFANSLFEPLWNRDRIASIEITVAECLGVEHRAKYYEGAGALRDMIQNHLTQLMTLTAMEVPSAFEAEAIRHEKAKVLRSVMPLNHSDVVYGQYTRGKIDGADVPGYVEEPGVASDSKTETFVALRLWIENWRWHGVPFFLRTGKRMASRASEIVVNFRRPPVMMFRDSGESALHANKLVMTIQPDEGFDIRFEIKKPGDAVELQNQNLSFKYSEVFEPLPEAYETLLLDVLKGDATLFVRDDWVEDSWRLYTPLIQNRPPVHQYPAGSWGPPEADQLMLGVSDGWTLP
jgi:glucose-6-phosphate 1-dehydrogenase